MKPVHVKLSLIGLGLALAAAPVHAAQDVPWTSATTKRDTQMRAAYGGWDYQPGYPKGTYPQEHVPGVSVAGAGKKGDSGVWRHPTPPVEVVPDPSLEPRTKTSIDAGFQFSRYRYEEPSVDVTNKALKYGFTGSATGVIMRDIFARVDGRFAFGDADYKGSGEKDGNTDRIYEVRAMLGMDVPFGRFVVSPYLGLGYRNLYNDLRGVTSTGAVGYRRESQYLYVPVGVQPRYQIDRNSTLSLNIEIDPLLQGWQFSQLSDAGLGDPDVHNKQDSGYGLRGELMYGYGRFSIGPFFNYWNIEDSNFAKCDPVTFTCFVEPKNETLEFGIQARVRLY